MDNSSCESLESDKNQEQVSTTGTSSASLNRPHDDELDSLRAAKRQAETKLHLLKKRYEEELATFNETRVEHILKNSGAREYFERMKDRTRIKDDIIKNLKEDLEYKEKEVATLRDRCREAEKQSQEYLKALKEAQLHRDRPEPDKRSNTPRERPTMMNHSFNMSSASSLVEHNTVPPPPPIDAPTIEEIFRVTTPAQQFEPQPVIPPPPEVEVPLDDFIDVKLANESDKKKAFEQEKGQFMCRVYLSVNSDSPQDPLSDIVELIEAEKTRSSSRAFRGWVSLNNQTDAFEKSDFHVTLLRGHRTIHYHQIKPLVAAMEEICKSFKSSSLCLDRLRLFSNYEKTKQFLAITTRSNQSAPELSEFLSLKRKLQDTIGQFAELVTEEDETEDTIPHCSIMYRDMQQVQNDAQTNEDLQEIENLCNENLEEYICLVKVDTINLKIGKEVYSFTF